MKMKNRKAISTLVVVFAAAMLCLPGALTASGKIGLLPSLEAPGGSNTPDELSGLQSRDKIPGQQLPGTIPDAQQPGISPGLEIPDTPAGLPSPETASSLTGSVQDETASQQPGQYAGNSAGLLRCLHYTEKDFKKFVNGTSPAYDTLFSINKGAGTGAIMGGIVPHHSVAGRLIAEFFRALAEDPPETVIVIGPNHKLEGSGEIQTNPTDWGTPFGILEADTTVTGRLAEEYGAVQNDDLFENEHSVSSLVPYIKYYLPETKIAPVLLHGSLSAEDAGKLGTLLGEIMSAHPGTVVIASIDFSHYLSAPEADKMDIITWNAVSSWDLEAISRMGNDNLDSVPSITALMTAMDRVSARSIELRGHNNSSRITKNSYDWTTSYFTMFFRISGQEGPLA